MNFMFIATCARVRGIIPGCQTSPGLKRDSSATTAGTLAIIGPRTPFAALRGTAVQINMIFWYESRAAKRIVPLLSFVSTMSEVML